MKCYPTYTETVEAVNDCEDTGNVDHSAMLEVVTNMKLMLKDKVRLNDFITIEARCKAMLVKHDESTIADDKNGACSSDLPVSMVELTHLARAALEVLHEAPVMLQNFADDMKEAERQQQEQSQISELCQVFETEIANGKQRGEEGAAKIVSAVERCNALTLTEAIEATLAEALDKMVAACVAGFPAVRAEASVIPAVAKLCRSTDKKWVETLSALVKATSLHDSCTEYVGLGKSASERATADENGVVLEKMIQAKQALTTYMAEVGLDIEHLGARLGTRFTTSGTCIQNVGVQNVALAVDSTLR